MAANCKVRAEALDAYLHGMLNEAQQRELNAHLLVCPECNRALSALEAETYTLGKGLRNVPAPAMSVSAADLVVRFAGSQSPGGTVELTEKEIADLEKADRAARRIDSRGVIRLANQAAVTTTQAVSFAHRRGLLKVAAIAFGAGLVVWFGVATAKKIDSLTTSVEELAKRDIDRESARLQREKDQAAQLEQNIDNLTRRMARERTLQQVENIERLNGLTKMLTDVQKGIASEINKYETQVANLTRTHDQQEQDRLSHEIESRALEAQLDVLRRNLNALRDKADGQDPALTDAGDVRELRLVPEHGIQIAFEKATETMSAQPLNFKSGSVGWAMALGSARMALSPIVPGPGKVGERVFEASGRINNGNVRADPQRCAAPAVMNSKIYIGNGLAEGDMVAIDGATGKQLWCYAVRDTVGAPVVTEDGTVYFTTEHGTLWALNEVKTQKGLQANESFHKYLGAITTQPAFDDKCIFVVHKTEFAGKPAGALGFRYSLTCLKSDNGFVNWTRGLNDDAISSPVACNGRVFVATRDGNLIVWDYNGRHVSTTPQVNATCAPVISGNSLYFTSWETHPRFGFNESLQKISLDTTLKAREQIAGPFKAAYFIAASATTISESTSEDNSPPVDDLDGAPAPESNGLPALHEAWTYMGARPTIIDQNAYVAIGDKLVCWDLKQNRAKWSCQVSGSSDGTGATSATSAMGQGQPPLTPPAYAAGKLYLGSIWGDVLCVDAQSGKQTWRYRFDNSKGISSQLVLDQGRAYATTGNGMLLCVDTGDQTATGWHSFGGSAGHNAKQ